MRGICQRKIPRIIPTTKRFRLGKDFIPAWQRLHIEEALCSGCEPVPQNIENVQLAGRLMAVNEAAFEMDLMVKSSHEDSHQELFNK